MKQELKPFLILFRYYFSLLLICILDKPLFMLYAGRGSAFSFNDFLQVLWHGLPMDCSIAAYLTVIPLLLCITTVIAKRFPLRVAMIPYNVIIALTLSLIFIGDAVLYPFWGFKLDSTIFFYLKTPKEALASVSVWFVLLGLIIVLIVGFLIFLLLNNNTKRWKSFCCNRWIAIPLFVLIVPLSILIKGGVKESTMNVGHSYFSTNQFLNHSAVNPAFSLFDSMTLKEDFDTMFNFFDEPVRSDLADPLFVTDSHLSDMLLETNRPNLLLVILESYGGDFVETISHTQNVSPRLDSLIKTGVYFSNCFANSFRTDRGVVSILNGYPALPVTSLMKLPNKNRTLPSIAKSLTAEGYSATFMYGGDINFTDMKSYLFSGGYQEVIADVDFSIAERHSNNWGVNDEYTFDRLYDIVSTKTDSLWHLSFLTLSSHEPFDVPFSRFEDPIPNSFAYTDNCLGDFVDRISKTEAWDNLLMVIVPDHGFKYINDGHRQSPHVHHIPMLWIGGAVKEPKVIDTIMSQSDLAATLMSQMGLDISEYKFSRNVLSDSNDYPFAFYTYINGFCMIDSTGVSMYDNIGNLVELSEGDGDEIRVNRGKAILQTLYDDLARR